MLTHTSRRRSRMIGFCTLILAVGCDAPKGDSGGRVEVHRTTKAEKKAAGFQIGDMASAADEVAQALAADINRLSDEEFGDSRIWLVFGDIHNRSTMPTSDIEMIRERLKDRLQRSRLFRANIKFVARRAEVESLNEAEYGRPDDPLQEGLAQDGVDRGEEQHQYYLRGKVYSVLRGSTESNYLSFNLTRARDGAEVFSQEYEMKYSKR